MKLRIHIVRHGEVFNPEGLMYERMPGFRISSNGELQARQCGQFLFEQLGNNDGFDATKLLIYHSPMLRTKQTAQNILKTLQAQNKENRECNGNTITTPDSSNLIESKQLNEALLSYQRGKSIEKCMALTDGGRKLYISIPSEFQKPHLNESLSNLISRIENFFIEMQLKYLYKEDQNCNSNTLKSSGNEINIIAVTHADMVIASHVQAKHNLDKPLPNKICKEVTMYEESERQNLGFLPSLGSISTFTFTKNEENVKLSNSTYFSHIYCSNIANVNNKKKDEQTLNSKKRKIDNSQLNIISNGNGEVTVTHQDVLA